MNPLLEADNNKNNFRKEKTARRGGNNIPVTTCERIS